MASLRRSPRAAPGAFGVVPVDLVLEMASKLEYPELLNLCGTNKQFQAYCETSRGFQDLLDRKKVEYDLARRQDPRERWETRRSINEDAMRILGDWIDDKNPVITAYNGNTVAITRNGPVLVARELLTNKPVGEPLLFTAFKNASEENYYRDRITYSRQGRGATDTAKVEILVPDKDFEYGRGWLNDYDLQYLIGDVLYTLTAPPSESRFRSEEEHDRIIAENVLFRGKTYKTTIRGSRYTFRRVGDTLVVNEALEGRHESQLVDDFPNRNVEIIRDSNGVVVGARMIVLINNDNIGPVFDVIEAILEL